MSKTSRDRQLHEKLQAAFHRDLISVYTNFDQLQSPKSPIFDPWLAVGPLLGLLLISMVLLLAGGLVIGTMAMMVAVVSYIMLIRPWLESVFRQRATDAMVGDLHSFLMVWEYGGVGLSLVGRPETMVAAPGGSWRGFVLRHLPDAESSAVDPELMTKFQVQDVPGHDQAMDRQVVDLNHIEIPTYPRTGEVFPPTEWNDTER